jgi:modification methylase
MKNLFVDKGNYKLYKGECLEVLKQIESESVDMIFTSPPYNIGLKDRKDTNIATYDSWDDDLDYQEYCKWQVEILNECYRIVKKGGALFYNHKDKFKDETYKNPIEILFQTKWEIKQNIIWDRGSAISYNAGMFGDVYENIYYCYKEISPKTKTNHNVLGTIWRINRETQIDHPAPFPLELPLRAIYSIFDNEENKVVMDIFNGSGTTGVASLLLNHKYIGIDISEKYLNMSVKRLDNYINESERGQKEIDKHKVMNEYVSPRRITNQQSLFDLI